MYWNLCIRFFKKRIDLYNTIAYVVNYFPILHIPPLKVKDCDNTVFTLTIKTIFDGFATPIKEFLNSLSILYTIFLILSIVNFLQFIIR